MPLTVPRYVVDLSELLLIQGGHRSFELLSRYQSSVIRRGMAEDGPFGECIISNKLNKLINKIKINKYNKNKNKYE